jgi:hypothetical protein
MLETGPKQNKPEQEAQPTHETLEGAEKDPIALQIEEAELAHEKGDPEGALDILEDAIDKAYREQKMDLYEKIVGLMDEWGV